MANASWGRAARMYVAPVVYDTGALVPLDFADLVEVTRTQDITSSDEAGDLVATARDLEYSVHAQGDKTLVVETEKLLNVDDSGDDLDYLRTAYDDGTEVWVLVTRKAKSVSCGAGMLFRANVFGWPEKYPLSEAATVSLKLIQSSPGDGVQRIATPVVSGSGTFLGTWIYDDDGAQPVADISGRFTYIEIGGGAIGAYVAQIDQAGEDRSDVMAAIQSGQIVTMQWSGTAVTFAADGAPSEDAYSVIISGESASGSISFTNGVAVSFYVMDAP